MAEETLVTQRVETEGKRLSPGGLKLTRTKTKNGMNAIGISAPSLPAPVTEKRKFYWCGVTEDCPRQVVHAGGFDFPAFIQKQEQDENDPMRSVLSPTKYSGVIHAMNEAHMRKCLDGIAGRIVRESDPKRGIKMLCGGRGSPYQPHEKDVPLAKFVYMVEVDDPDVVNRAYPPKDVPTLLRG